MGYSQRSKPTAGVRHHAFGIFAVIVIIAGCSSSAPPVAPPGAQIHVPRWKATHSARAACSGSRIDQAQCDVLIETGGALANYAGWGAKELETAYNLPITRGKGQSVYVVDAYDNPNVANDFAAYRKGMGLPTGRLKKYNQTGGKGKYPPGSPDWGVEIDLDVEMASASCPECTITLVEADTNQWSDLEAAEAEAVKLGATIVSNSFSGSGADESYFDTKGVTYLASAGDLGYGVYDPATFQAVISVGGTELSVAENKRGYKDVAWADSGGGCSSTDEAKPTWQHDPDCKYRTANDVAAVALDAAEYDTYDEGGWITVDGTSISSPLVAGTVALAGNSTKQDGGEMLWTLSRAEQKKHLYNVTSGGDGGSCQTYLCECGTKQFGRYCGPGGWGTPHGAGAL
jgi:subtilase family serine protease